MQGLMMGFHVARPTDVDGVMAAIAEGGPGTKLLAGGTDLLIQLRFGVIHPSAVVDLSGVSSLQSLTVVDGALRIGARATVTSVEWSPEVAARFPALREPAQQLGSRQIRNTATVAGNVCHASPSAEFTPALIALDARVEIRGPTGDRVLPVEDFVVGPGQNALEEGEMVTALLVPAPPARTGACYDGLKVRKIMDIAVVSAAASVTLDASGAVCEDARIALGAVAAVPFRATEAEDLLRGQELTPELLDMAARAAGDAAKPITDVRATREYRAAMIVRSARRALNRATERARA
jgi:carbon-monoxide dehydrogenase medium subunit